MAITSAFIKKTLKKHLPKLGDAIVDSVYTKFTNQTPDYDPDTEVINDPSTTFPIGVIFADFSFTKNQSGFKEIENTNVLAKDKKGIVQVIEFPVGVKPEIDDLVTNSDTGTVYFVVGRNVDPYNAIYLLHLRPKEEA